MSSSDLSLDDLRPDPQAAPPPPRRSPWRRLGRWALGTLATLIVLLALALGAVRVLLLQVPEYRDQIQAWVNETTRLDFRFSSIDARWRFYGPELYVTDARLHAPNGGPLLAEARAASIGVDIWRVLFRAELLAGRIRLIEPEIALLRTSDGRLELAGQAALDPSDESRFDMNDLPTGRLEIVGARVSLEDQLARLGALTLDDVDLEVARDRDEVTIEGTVALPPRLGAVLDFEGEASGSLGDPETVAWRFDVAGRGLTLAGWREFLGDTIPLPESGTGSIEIKTGMHGSRLVSASLDMALTDVTLGANELWPAPMRYTSVSGDVELVRSREGWKLEGQGVELSTAARRWRPSSFHASWSRDARGLASVRGSADYVRLENLLPLVSRAPASRWRDRVLELNPEGELRRLTVAYARREGAGPAYEASARLTNVGFHAMGRAPGLRGVTGDVSIADTGGRANIESQGLGFSLPYMFRETLVADTARGEIEWTHTNDGWNVSSRQFQVRNAHASAVADLDLHVPADRSSSPVLKLKSQFRDAVLREGWRYLPINRLNERTLAWLDAAFLAGTAPGGEFVFEGPTRRFPFREGEGEFRIAFPVQGLTLHYADGWPDIEALAADVEFHNQGLTATVREGRVQGLALESGRVGFEDLREAELRVKARANGDLANALGFAQTSPLGPALGRLFMDVRGRGPSQLDVDLFLPVKEIANHRVDVLAELQNANLSLSGTPHALEAVQGSVHIQNRRVSSPAPLSARYLGGAMNVELAVDARPGRVDDVVRVRAETPAAALASALHAPAFVKTAGTIDWRGVARIPIEEESERAPSVRIETPLRGTSIDLPAPFAKDASEQRPVRVDLEWPSATETSVRATYGTQARAALRFDKHEADWKFARGVLRFGDGELRVPAAGLEIQGSLDAVDLSQWLALGSQGGGQPGTSGRRVSDVLRAADVSVKELTLFGFEFPDVDATLRAEESAWAVTVDSPKARGGVRVPYVFDRDPLVLDLSKLTLGDATALAKAAEARADSAEDPDPRRWPAVEASIDQFEAWGKRLGSVRADLVRDPGGLQLQSFTATAPSFTAEGKGSWLVGPDGARCNLDLRFASTDVLATLQDLGYGASLTGRRGILDAQLHWPGAPSATLVSRLSGTVRIEIDDGQLVNVQPGAGRVFGLMSVAALPRRLSLDFSDFLSKGLSFDSIRGDFRLDDGNAYTENLLLRGPSAEIGIVGRTGLATRDYDQTAVVTGSVGNSLPIVGALAGGPVVGAGLLLFSQIFKGPLKGIARGYYRITGPWDDPDVQRVEASEGRKAEGAAKSAEEPEAD